MIGRARLSRAGLALAALALLWGLAPAPALCAGARPWLAPGEQNATDPATATDPASATANATQAAPAEIAVTADPAKALQEDVLRAYYQRLWTMDRTLPALYSRRVRDEQAQAHSYQRYLLERRGKLQAFLGAAVRLDELRFERISSAPDMVRWTVKGKILIDFATSVATVDEDALFVLLPEDGGWKIWERRDN